MFFWFQVLCNGATDFWQPQKLLFPWFTSGWFLTVFPATPCYMLHVTWYVGPVGIMRLQVIMVIWMLGFCCQDFDAEILMPGFWCQDFDTGILTPWYHRRSTCIRLTTRCQTWRPSWTRSSATLNGTFTMPAELRWDFSYYFVSRHVFGSEWMQSWCAFRNFVSCVFVTFELQTGSRSERFESLTGKFTMVST